MEKEENKNGSNGFKAMAAAVGVVGAGMLIFNSQQKKGGDGDSQGTAPDDKAAKEIAEKFTT